eukprot:scaffold3498_cov112-Isochrysis_galbana.AAC.6
MRERCRGREALQKRDPNRPHSTRANRSGMWEWDGAACQRPAARMATATLCARGGACRFLDH